MIKLLDCTLRDGGYVNDWSFGKNNISSIIYSGIVFALSISMPLFLMTIIPQDKVYKNTIPRNIRLAEAPGYGMAITQYDPKSKGAEAYIEFAAEFLEREAE